MKSLHSNILKLMDSIINKIADNIHDFSVSDQAFTRCRKLNSTDLIKLILNMGAGSLNSEIFHAFPDMNSRMTASAFEQQKAKLKPECFKEIMSELSQANNTLQLLDNKYLVVAIDGSDFDQPFNPESENIFRGKDGRIYCQLHVNALYDVLNKLYLDMVIQPRQKMDEREAALTMLKKLAQQEKDFLVLMDRGYISFIKLFVLKTLEINGGILRICVMLDSGFASLESIHQVQTTSGKYSSPIWIEMNIL